MHRSDPNRLEISCVRLESTSSRGANAGNCRAALGQRRDQTLRRNIAHQHILRKRTSAQARQLPHRTAGSLPRMQPRIRSAGISVAAHADARQSQIPRTRAIAARDVLRDLLRRWRRPTVSASEICSTPHSTMQVAGSQHFVQTPRIAIRIAERHRHVRDHIPCSALCASVQIACSVSSASSGV